MVGCYSDSRLLNGAAAQLLPLIRWPDLDSHLNLVDDPFRDYLWMLMYCGPPVTWYPASDGRDHHERMIWHRMVMRGRPETPGPDVLVFAA